MKFDMNVNSKCKRRNGPVVLVDKKYLFICIRSDLKDSVLMQTWQQTT